MEKLDIQYNEWFKLTIIPKEIDKLINDYIHQYDEATKKLLLEKWNNRLAIF